MRTRKQISPALEEKYRNLCDHLRRLDKLAVAFSGGVDSALLLKVAHDTLGERTLAITANSPTFPEREITATREFCKTEGIRHIVFDSHACEGAIFEQNPPDRCYFCKKMLLREIDNIAHDSNASVAAEGSNLDDEHDYRPGLTALGESNVISPLRRAKFTKDDIRTLAHHLDLPMWNKPSFACLATRIPYGQQITSANLIRIDNAERMIIDLGFDQVRVRCDNNHARIEVEPSEITRLEQLCDEYDIFRKFQDLGFSDVVIDEKGYVPGNLKRSDSFLNNNQPPVDTSS